MMHFNAQPREETKLQFKYCEKKFFIQSLNPWDFKGCQMKVRLMSTLKVVIISLHLF